MIERVYSVEVQISAYIHMSRLIPIRTDRKMSSFGISLIEVTSVVLLKEKMRMCIIKIYSHLRTTYHKWISLIQYFNYTFDTPAQCSCTFN